MVPLFHAVRPSARRVFISAAYTLDDCGVLRVELPCSCPLRQASDPPCKIARHQERQRKTGPGFALVVAVCRTHRKHFTLYPPGYPPYRREPLVELAPDGSEPLGEASTASSHFEGTLFQAAFDARDGKAWARNSHAGVEDRWWATQLRHLDLSLRIVGLHRGLTDQERETIAATLGVDQLMLREHATRTTGYRARGAAVAELLERLPRGPRRQLSLLHSGHVIGHWAEPVSWDHRRSVFEGVPFRAPGIEHPT